MSEFVRYPGRGGLAGVGAATIAYIDASKLTGKPVPAYIYELSRERA